MPQELREDLANMFLLDEEMPSSFPQLLVESEELFGTDAVISVVVEGDVICSCGDFFSAFCLLFATYYIFNLAYPDSLFSTLAFFQKAFLGIHDGTKDAKVSRLLTTLLSNST